MMGCGGWVGADDTECRERVVGERMTTGGWMVVE